MTNARRQKGKDQLEYIYIDDRNAILFNELNTKYINEQIRYVTENPKLRVQVYADMAKHFALDYDKINRAIVLYVNKLKGIGRRKDNPQFVKDVRKLCGKIGHRFIEIRLSQLRGYRECERCGKVERSYRISGAR